ncbi:MAG: bifunctional methylenetetrahydrofolate dehydrogenase/methenyltetrahydrofolate cyclohydrolase FolD [Christensenellales bacterium]|jgi:methylenetetrahydrofolate dehydrogenase (NADP+)/methenyltetrahydrofolate cyclohydrolase
MAVLMDGSLLAKKTRIALKKRVSALPAPCGLGVILVGDDPASAIYVGNKERACEKIGIVSVVKRLPTDSTTEDVLRAVDAMNRDEILHGYIVQLPMPKQIDEREVLRRVSPEKDADGLHEANAAKLFLGEKGVLPCTPRGCIALLKEYGVPLSGKRAVVIGRSRIVGKPVAMMLLAENCTVTMCHSRTENLAQVIREADIVIAAVGKPCMIKGDMIKPGAAVIDVGINRLPDGTVAGDVDFDSCEPVAGFITPVPGGVGPMTIAMLLQNTVELCEKSLKV